MTTKYPKNFARFYDVIYNQLRDAVDHDFFLNEIKKTKGKVLEIGVGTGRFFTDALSQGADIYGIDVSENMMNILRGKLGDNQHYRTGIQNIIDFSFKFQFDLIIAPFRVIMHLIDKADQLKALNNVHKHLELKGRFIFDTFVPDLNLLINGFHNYKDFEGEYEPGKKLARYVTNKPDLINQLINIHFRLEWEENNKSMREDWELQLRFFFRFELEHLIERSEFKEYKILGDFQGNGLNETSKEFIMICQK
jgi:SAM-dependent methyltransferase